MKMRRFIGALVALMMLLAAIPAAAGGTRAPVSYIDGDGAEQTCAEYSAASADDEIWSGWIAVTEDVTIDGRVSASGSVNLILLDGKTLNVRYGIEVSELDSLTVYGQAGGTGVLNAGDEEIVSQITERNYAGVGGNNHLNCGAVTINGGVVNARGADGAAGIGGGFFSGGGTIVINNGTVNAYGGDSGDGIGDGESSDDTCDITINGGTVNAYGGPSAAGIGTNGWENLGSITINGGTVYARGGENTGANGDFAGAGIGGDPIGAEVEIITINGGVVTAEGGALTNPSNGGGVGIGGGSNGGYCRQIVINGGVVNAAGTGDLPAIGAGGGVDFTANEPNMGSITINGGRVTATADCDFAIGGYCDWGEEATAGIELGWTNEDDFILSDGYMGDVTLIKDFAVEDSDETFAAGEVEDNSALAGKKLIPPVTEPAGYTVTVIDYTKNGAALTGLVSGGTYSGEVAFGAAYEEACALGVLNADGSITRLACTTDGDTHSFTINVEADMTIVIVVKGDADLNGRLQNKDATLIMQVKAGDAEFDEATAALQTFAGDADGNGRLANKDATLILQAKSGDAEIVW